MLRAFLYGCTACSLHKRAWPKGQVGAETQPLLIAKLCTLVQGCVYVEARTLLSNLTKIPHELSEALLILYVYYLLNPQNSSVG